MNALSRSTTMLEVSDLGVTFATRRGRLHAVDGLSYRLNAGETLAIVGESGCGKSVAAMSILGLVPQPPGEIKGTVRFGDQNLVALEERELEKMRGREISMIFQEPMTSLNPVLTVGEQIAEILMLHRDMSRRSAMEAAIEALRLVQIPEPKLRISDYPHQMSGGMRQRVMIAIALACSPKVLIADEPTTALDVTIQAQILELMRQLQNDLGTSILLITHDMGVVAENADRVIVMYAGRKVEEADVRLLFATPRHPYTVGLLKSIPRTASGQRRLAEIRGSVPSLTSPPPGCRFAARCALASHKCRKEQPPLEEKATGHVAACWHSDKIDELKET